MTRLNLLLGLLLVVLVGGPYAVPWVMERVGLRSPEAPPLASPRPAPGVEALPTASAPSASEAGPEAALAREAFTLLQQGRVAEACERYREVARRLGSATARQNVAACLGRLARDADQAGAPDLAASHYEAAIRDFPEMTPLWLGLATVLVKARDLERAESVLGQGVQAFPGDADLLYLLAEVQERRGRTRDATEALRRLIAAHPAHPRGRALLAALERDQKVETGYWSQESRHFLVRYEGATGLDVGRAVVDTLEEAYDSIGRELGVLPGDRIQVGIYATEVFADVTGAPPHLIAGAYDRRRIRLNFGSSRLNSRGLSELVRHEYAHAVIHQASSGQAPIWVHEGLAQVLEPRAAPRALRVRVSPDLLTLDGIERLSRTGNPGALVAGYALTHVAVDYLLERGGMGRMRDFLARLGRGESTEQALREAFALSSRDIEARLQAVAQKP